MCSQQQQGKVERNLFCGFVLSCSSKLCNVVDDWCKVGWTIKYNLTQTHVIGSQYALNAYSITHNLHVSASDANTGRLTGKVNDVTGNLQVTYNKLLVIYQKRGHKVFILLYLILFYLLTYIL